MTHCIRVSTFTHRWFLNVALHCPYLTGDAGQNVTKHFVKYSFGNFNIFVIIPCRRHSIFYWEIVPSHFFPRLEYECFIPFRNLVFCTPKFRNFHSVQIWQIYMGFCMRVEVMFFKPDNKFCADMFSCTQMAGFWKWSNFYWNTLYANFTVQIFLV